VASPQKAAKKRADLLFSQIVRSVGYCERCHRRPPEVQLQTSHWIGRTSSNTRTDFDNAFCLCAACHRWWHSDPTAATDWAISQRGRETYDRLREAANEKSKVWWPDELKRLQQIAKESA
jgi:hypothetical protein